MIPQPDTLFSWAGVRLSQPFPAENSGATNRTWKNWFQGKSTPRRSTLIRAFEGLTRDLKTDIDVSAQIEQLHTRAEKKDKLLFLQWEECIVWFELSPQSEQSFLINEIKQFLELTRSLIPYAQKHDLEGFGDALEKSFIPKTSLIRSVIHELKTATDFSEIALNQAIAHATFSNTLYLVACIDPEHRYLSRLCPQFNGTEITMPITLYLDAVRKDHSLSSDKALGQTLYPHQDEESAAREIKKWRSGKLPTWKQVCNLKPSLPHDKGVLHLNFAIIRLLHAIFEAVENDEGNNIGLNSKKLFSTSDQLQKIACARAPVQ